MDFNQENWQWAVSRVAHSQSLDDRTHILSVSVSVSVSVSARICDRCAYCLVSALI